MGSSALSFTGTNNNINGVPVIKKSIINVLETTSNNSSQMGGAASLNQTQKIMIPKKGPIKVLKQGKADNDTNLDSNFFTQTAMD